MTEHPYTEPNVPAMIRRAARVMGLPSPAQEIAEALGGIVNSYLGELAAAGRLLPEGASTDVLLADGTHRYWSTHCRHGNHEACAADRLPAWRAPAQLEWLLPPVTTIERNPAQCKTCASPCICPCHATPPTINEESPDG